MPYIYPLISATNEYKTAQQTHKQTTKKLHRFVPFNRPTPPRPPPPCQSPSPTASGCAGQAGHLLLFRIGTQFLCLRSIIKTRGQRTSSNSSQGLTVALSLSPAPASCLPQLPLPSWFRLQLWLGQESKNQQLRVTQSKYEHNGAAVDVAQSAMASSLSFGISPILVIHVYVAPWTMPKLKLQLKPPS